MFLNTFPLNGTSFLLSFFDTPWITSDELSNKKRQENAPSFCLTCGTEKGEKTVISIFRWRVPHHRSSQLTVKHKDLCNTKGNNKR